MEFSSVTKKSLWCDSCVRSVPEWRPKRQLYEDEKLKTGFPWRPQDAGNVRAMEYLLQKDVNMAAQEKAVCFHQ